MSFVKSLECDFCKDIFPIGKVNFPEDLFDLIRTYKEDQLIWLCCHCKKKKDQTMVYFLNLAEKQKHLENEVSDLKEIVKRLSSASLTEEKFNGKMDNDFIADEMSLQSTDELNGTFESVCESDHSFTDQSVSPRDDNSNTFENSLSLLSNKSTAVANNKFAIGIIQAVLKEKIKIDESELANSKKVVKSFLEDLLTYLKKDEDFKCIFNELYYTGSSYEDLRITNATEYDINLVLNLPEKIKTKVEFYPYTNTFAKCVWHNNATQQCQINENVAKFLKLASDGNYLMPAKILAWMQSILTKTLQSKPKFSADIQNVTTKTSGPAHTIIIETVYGYTLNIDLVPVLKFKYRDLEGSPTMKILNDYQVTEVKKFWFLVPKQCDGGEKEFTMSVQDCKISWRIHFPEVEKYILHNKFCAKPIIKLLKLLRDQLKWRKVASYYLKTVMLWEMKKHPDSEYWREDLIFQRAVEMLKLLKKYMEDNHLPYFFDPKYNLIRKMNAKHCLNCYHQLEKLIQAIEKDPASLSTVFQINLSNL